MSNLNSWVKDIAHPVSNQCINIPKKQKTTKQKIYLANQFIFFSLHLSLSQSVLIFFPFSLYLSRSISLHL